MYSENLQARVAEIKDSMMPEYAKKRAIQLAIRNAETTESCADTPPDTSDLERRLAIALEGKVDIKPDPNHIYTPLPDSRQAKVWERYTDAGIKELHHIQFERTNP